MKHVLGALVSVLALVGTIVFGFSLATPDPAAGAALNCSVQGSRSGNAIYVVGSGACQGLAFNFNIDDVSGSGGGAVNIGLPTEFVTEFITQLTTITAQAQKVIPRCSATPQGNNIRVICTALGQRVLNVNLPVSVVTITAPAIRSTETVTVGGPTQLVTRYAFTNAPLATRTITSENVVVTTAPASTVTETVRETITADAVTEGKDNSSRIEFLDGKVTTVEASIGLLTLLVLTTIILVALYSGYVIGWKDKEGEEADFFGALLDRAKTTK